MNTPTPDHSEAANGRFRPSQGHRGASEKAISALNRFLESLSPDENLVMWGGVSHTVPTESENRAELERRLGERVAGIIGPVRLDPVDCVAADGEVVCQFASTADAAKWSGASITLITRAADDGTQRASHFWKWPKRQFTRFRRKGVAVYSLGPDGKETHYNSIYAAADAVGRGPTAIYGALKSGGYSAGLRWRAVGGKYAPRQAKNSRNMPVRVFLFQQPLPVANCVSDAAKYAGVSWTTVWRHLHDGGETRAGYRFEYANMKGK